MKIPQRMCIACREMKDKRTLLRMRVNETGEIEYDPTGKKSGRGAYICNSGECLNKAKKYNLIEKALEAKTDENFFDALLNGKD